MSQELLYFASFYALGFVAHHVHHRLFNRLHNLAAAHRWAAYVALLGDALRDYAIHVVEVLIAH